jgi:hypothetical protein
MGYPEKPAYRSVPSFSTVLNTHLDALHLGKTGFTPPKPQLWFGERVSHVKKLTTKHVKLGKIKQEKMFLASSPSFGNSL